MLLQLKEIEVVTIVTHFAAFVFGVLFGPVVLALIERLRKDSGGRVNE